MLENIVWENVVYTTTFLVKFSLVLQDIWNEVMKHQRPYKSALVFCRRRTLTQNTWQ